MACPLAALPVVILVALLSLAGGAPLAAQLTALGEDFSLSDDGHGYLSGPMVASNAAGDVVSAWVGHRPFPFTNTDTDVLFTRRLDRKGQPIGSEFAAVWLQNMEEGRSLAVAPDGSYVLAWIETGGPSASWDYRLLIGRWSQSGAPLWRRVEVDRLNGPLESPSLTVTPGGSILVTWVRVQDELQVMARAFRLDGTPRGPGLRITQEIGVQQRPALARLADNRCIVVWSRLAPSPDYSQVVARTLSCDGSELGAEWLIDDKQGHTSVDPAVGTVGAGSFAVVWGETANDTGHKQIRGQLFDDEATPRGDLFTVSPGEGFAGFTQLSVAGDSGRWLVAWQRHDGGVGPSGGFPALRAYDLEGEPLSPIIPASTVSRAQHHSVALTALEQGQFVAVWATTLYPTFSSATSSGVSPGSLTTKVHLPELEDNVSITGRRFVLSADQLYLVQDRFRLEVDWIDSRAGTTGRAQSVNLTDNAGVFWFFGREEVELVVKMVDGRPVNGHFWFFSGPLTDLEFTLTVTDTETGVVRTYFNPLFDPTSLMDTAAF